LIAWKYEEGEIPLEVDLNHLPQRKKFLAQ